jgi:hypothetical protein
MSDEDQPEGPSLEVLAESENYAVLLGQDADGESVYNVELGSVTLHLFQEEWEELVALIAAAARA